MSLSNSATVTVRGRAAGDPEYHVPPAGEGYVRFRLACTPSFFSQRDGQWHDHHTEWFTVRVFSREFGCNVSRSVRKGNPVIVTGRFSTRDWDNPTTGKHGHENVITAEAVSHDLAWCASHHERVVYSARVPQPDGADAGQVEAAGIGQGDSVGIGPAEAAGPGRPEAASGPEAIVQLERAAQPDAAAGPDADPWQQPALEADSAGPEPSATEDSAEEPAM
jgi:single-strand DNA-binding protein